MRAILIVYNISFSSALREFLEVFLDIVIVDTFREANTALDKIPSLDPDIVVIDLDKQGQLGIDLIQQLRDTSHKLVIIAIATEDTEGFKETTFNAGANAYVPKAKIAKDLVPAMRQEISRLSGKSHN